MLAVLLKLYKLHKMNNNFRFGCQPIGKKYIGKKENKHNVYKAQYEVTAYTHL